MVRARGEVFVSRAKSTTEYLGKLVADGAKTAQDNFSKVYTQDRLIAFGSVPSFEGPLMRAFFLSRAPVHLLLARRRTCAHSNHEA